MTPEQAQTLVGREFVHFKGNRYRLVAIAKHSETLEPIVVYRALYGEGGVWVRPFAMFFEDIDRDGYRGPRFRLAEDGTDGASATATKSVPDGNAFASKALWGVGWFAAWLIGAFLGLLLFSEASDTAVLPVETLTGVSTGIQNLDTFAVGRFMPVIALICAFVLLRFLFQRPNIGSIAKTFAALAVGAFYSAATLAYIPEIGPLNLITGGSSTVYGKGFSRAGFKKVKPGMTKADVAALVGEGVDINAMGFEIDHERNYSSEVARWFLSGPGTHENYWKYGVEFTTNGVVDHTWCLFWYD